jgi:hypothetical protein
VLPAGTSDRPLDGDLAIAQGLLPAMAAAAQTRPGNGPGVSTDAAGLPGRRS